MSFGTAVITVAVITCNGCTARFETRELDFRVAQRQAQEAGWHCDCYMDLCPDCKEIEMDG